VQSDSEYTGTPLRTAVEKLLDSTSFENTELRHFVVTVRPELLGLIERAMREAILATDDMFLVDPLIEADYQDVGRSVLRHLEKETTEHVTR
jgi:hypothetical protein